MPPRTKLDSAFWWEVPLLLCLLEHKLQAEEASSIAARAELEALGASHGYEATWTFSPRSGLDGLVVLVRSTAAAADTPLRPVGKPVEPTLESAACTRERRVLHVELASMHVVLLYAPNSGRDGRLAFRLEQWEPSVRALLHTLQRTKPLLLQGDLNVARLRELDCWGDDLPPAKRLTAWGRGKASGRTPEEQAALATLLDTCGLIDGFRHFYPAERQGSTTCWAQKTAGAHEPRGHWKRYDYACATANMVDAADGHAATAVRLVDVRHRGDAFEGGRPDHVPVESVLQFV